MFAEISFDIDKISNHTIIIAVVGYLVVFIALVTSYFLFSNLPRILKINPRKFFEKRRAAKEQKNQEPVVISGEMNAAISMALYLCLEEEHDEEDMVLTLKKASKRYSPWSSKIYTLSNYGHFKKA